MISIGIVYVIYWENSLYFIESKLQAFFKVKACRTQCEMAYNYVYKEPVVICDPIMSFLK